MSFILALWKHLKSQSIETCEDDGDVMDKAEKYTEMLGDFVYVYMLVS